MKLLHTADWHLGRSFEGHSLDEDHRHVLDQVFEAVVRHRPDVLIVAGDLFDRASPPETAVRLFNDFMQRLTAETACAVVLIAGNHDSGERIGAMSMLADRNRALVRGPVASREPPLVLADEHGAVAISALPFAYEFAARDCFGDSGIKSPADVMAAQVAAARQEVPEGARWVIVAHAFVEGGAGSDGERTLSRAVGGVETVPAAVFDGADYVALGHLHRPQSVGRDTIRYSGSPLAFGFDEEGQQKSMTLVELGGDGEVSSETIPFQPLRQVRALKGSLSDILAEAEDRPSEDFIKVTLRDAQRRIDPMKRIRAHYPNASLAYETAGPLETKSKASLKAGVVRPEDVIAAFLDFAAGDLEAANEGGDSQPPADEKAGGKRERMDEIVRDRLGKLLREEPGT